MGADSYVAITSVPSSLIALLVADLPFRWDQPRTWPPFFYIWLAFLLASPLLSLWRWIRKETQKSWPTTTGQIVSTRVEEPKRFFGLATGSDGQQTGLLSYSYVISGITYRGTFKRVFGSELEARDFFRGLEGQTVAVRYN